MNDQTKAALGAASALFAKAAASADPVTAYALMVQGIDVAAKARAAMAPTIPNQDLQAAIDAATAAAK